MRGKKPKEGVWGNLRSWYPQIPAQRLCGRAKVVILSGIRGKPLRSYPH